MKIKTISTFALSLFVGLSLVQAGDSHDHPHPHKEGHDHSHPHPHGPKGHHDKDHREHGHGHHKHAKKVAGPNGGRIITKVIPHIEFLVKEDGMVQLTVLDGDGNPIPPKEEVITAIGGDRLKPTRLTFQKTNGVFISDKALPTDKTIPVILEIKPRPKAKGIREKFKLNMTECPTCEYKEYACICEHDHHGHDHDHHDHEH